MITFCKSEELRIDEAMKNETDRQMPEQQTEKTEAGLPGSTLKMLAIVTMLIDHIAAGFIERGLIPALANEYGMDSDIVNTWSVIDSAMRCVGRMAFPIFCFLLVEGYFHTKNIKKYLGRLFVFTLVSEIPFNLAFYNSVWAWEHQNVYFTLFLGLLAVCLCDKIRSAKYGQRIFSILVLVAFGILALLLRTDYEFVGVLLIFVFYVLHDNEFVRDIAGAVTLLGAGMIEIAGFVAFIPMHFYNGERGWRLKYIFYLFYPVHLLIIALVRIAVFGS